MCRATDLNWLRRILYGLNRNFALEELLYLMERRIMSNITDLTDAVTRLNASVSAELAAIANSLGGDNPDVAAAVAAINAVSDKLDAETTALIPPVTP